MASTKQQKPGNESSPQEQHKFWGSKVFGGQKQSIDRQSASKEQSNGWWFNNHHKQGQHCSTCKCEETKKKDHMIGITITEDHTAIKNGKGTLKQSAKTETKIEEQSHVKKKELRENHCFRGVADHVKQRIAMMKNSHGDSSSSDSDDEKTEEKKKKKEKGQSQGIKIAVKNEKSK